MGDRQLEEGSACDSILQCSYVSGQDEKSNRKETNNEIETDRYTWFSYPDQSGLRK